MTALLFLLFSLALWSVPVVIAKYRKHNLWVTTLIVVTMVFLDVFLVLLLDKHMPIGIMVGLWVYSVYLAIFHKQNTDDEFRTKFNALIKGKKAPPSAIEANEKDSK